MSRAIRGRIIEKSIKVERTISHILASLLDIDIERFKNDWLSWQPFLQHENQPDQRNDWDRKI